jgi:hypothetical protein
MTTTNARQYQRRRTVAQWAAENPTLTNGEIGVAIQAGNPVSLKVGDGITAWNSLDWVDMRGGESISSTEMHTTASRISTNRVPRIVMPATGTTSAIVGPKGFPTYWFGRSIVMGFDWVNDHTATGDVRFRFILQENNIGGSIQSPDTVHDETVTIAAPAANGGIITNLVNSGNTVTLSPGAFGSLYTFEFQRLGDDAADTLAGPMGLAEFVFIAAK